MKKLLFTLLLFAASFSAYAQPTPVTPGGVTGKRVYTELIVGIDTGVVPYTYTGVVKIDSAFQFKGTSAVFSMSTMYTRDQVDSVAFAYAADTTIIATKAYVNALIDSLGELTNITYPNSSVLFVGSDGKPTTDSSNFIWDDTNNRLGLLTKTPTHTLELGANNANILLWNNSQIRFRDAATTERTAIHMNSSNNLMVGTSAGGNLIFINGASYTERARINVNGNFLIGNTTGSGRFNVWGSGTTSATYTAQFHNSTGTNNALMINDAGNIGIGTSSPAARLHARGDSTVSGNAFLVQAASNRNIFRVANSGIVYRADSTTTGSITLNTANDFYFTGSTATWVLDAVSTSRGAEITIVNAGSGTITLNSSAGANDIWTAGVLTNTVSILTNTTATYKCNGTSWFRIQ